MERLSQYQSIIEKYMDSLVEYYKGANRPTTFAILSSPLNHHIQLVEYGHTEDDWVYSILMHFVIENEEQVILLSNNTEEEPFDELAENGIPRYALQVGWVPPFIQAQLNKQAA